MINIKNNTRFTVFIIGLASILVLILIYLIFIFSYNKIYWNVKVNDIMVGGKTVSEAKEVLEKAYGPQTFEEKLYVTSNDVTLPLDVVAVDPKYSIDNTLKNIMEYGHSDNIFKRFSEIMTCTFGQKNFDMSVDLNEKPIDDLILELSKAVDSNNVDDKVVFDDDIMIITRGSKGYKINKENAKSDIVHTIISGKQNKLTIEPELIDPEPLTSQKIHSLVSSEPVDAKFQVVANKVNIIPEKPGVTFDEGELEKVLANSSDKREIKINVKLKDANITESKLKTMLFRDKLASYTTKYNPSEINRTSNVSLAASKINGIILGAGDQFSYNRIVGPRDASHGFKMAKVYVGDQIEDGMGGGICQVSSTLYNAVLMSDLNVTTRSNHSLSISYVPLGRDATVSYGYLDFVFVNNTKYPIKIVTSIGGGTLTTSIYGTNENLGKSIEIVTESDSSIAFKVKTVEDPSLPSGQIVVEKQGVRGAVVKTYKKIMQNGNVTNTVFLHKSTYLPQDRVERVGTGAVISQASEPVITNEPKNNEPPVSSPTSEPVKTPVPSITPTIVPDSGV